MPSGGAQWSGAAAAAGPTKAARMTKHPSSRDVSSFDRPAAPFEVDHAKAGSASQALGEVGETPLEDPVSASATGYTIPIPSPLVPATADGFLFESEYGVENLSLSPLGAADPCPAPGFDSGQGLGLGQGQGQGQGHGHHSIANSISESLLSLQDEDAFRSLASSAKETVLTPSGLNPLDAEGVCAFS